MNLIWVWAIVLVIVCGYVQAAVFRGMLKQQNREQARHIEAVAALIVAMQLPDIAEHSRRVAAISEKLARELRIPIRRLPLVRAMGLLHEVKEIDHVPDHLPVEAEVVAVADYLDEITCACNEPMSLDEAIDNIRQQAGTRFQPEVIKALMRLALQTEPKKV
jgi:HD-GYP domain-containing protein (c-di-GMP phosphodiesterase class II)